MQFEGFHDKTTNLLNFNPTISLKEESLLLNGELYNYFQLMKDHNLENESKTSAEVFLRLLSVKGFDSLKLMNADYSLAYKKWNKLFLIRDLIGTHPLYYADTNEFFKFTDSEFEDCIELPSGTLLEYDLETKILKLHERVMLSRLNVFSSYDEMMETFAKELFRSISSRVYNLDKFAVVSKGNTETKIITKVCKDLSADFFPANPTPVKESLSEDLKTIKLLTEEDNFDLVQFYFACKKAKEAGLNIIISDLGSGLLTQDSINPLPYYYISKHFNLKARYPFLDLKLVQALLRVDKKYKQNLLTVLLEQLE